MDATHEPPIGDRSAETLMPISRFHAGRPRPGQRPTPAPSPDMFWSLSFATDRLTWHEIGGFDERYVGYGGEDTDFAYSARRRGVTLWFDGDALAFHQYHTVSSPPIEHVSDIVSNAGLFHEKWGTWPMTGWLDQFARRGLIEWHPDGDTIACAGDIAHAGDEVPGPSTTEPSAAPRRPDRTR